MPLLAERGRCAACGATLTVELAPNANAERVRKYTVPAEYRNRNDAKLAVVLHAVEQGVIEFLRFFGKPPPLGYVANYARPDSQFFNSNKKRKNWDSGSAQGGAGDRPNRGSYNNGFAGGDGGNWPNKKPRMGNPPNGYQQGPSGNLLGPPAQGGVYGQHGHFGFGGGYQNGGGFQQSNRGFQNGGTAHKPGWNGQQKKPFTKNPHGPGPGQFGGPTAPFQPGPRNVGGPSHLPHKQQQQQRVQPFVAAPPFSIAQPAPPAPLAPSPPFAFPANGAVASGSMPPQTGPFGAVPQGPHVRIPYQAQTGPSHAPYGTPQPAPGGVPYSAFVPPQPQPPAAGIPPMSQYPQYPYSAVSPAPAQVPGQPQIPGYQPFSPVPPQPVRTGFYPTPAATPVPQTARPPPASASHSPAISPPPYIAGHPHPAVAPANRPSVPGSSTGYTAYNSPFGPQRPQPPIPQVSPPPLPIIPPPPPPPTISAPPPPPPSTAAPPLPPGPSVTSSKHGSRGRESKPSNTVSTGSPAASSSTHSGGGAPSKSGKVSIQSVAKTSVAALYGACLQILCFGLALVRSAC